MARIAFAAVFVTLGLPLAGCGSGDALRWGGFVLGQPTPTNAFDPARSPVGADGRQPPHALFLQHALMIPSVPEFPWQEAFAQVDGQRRVIAVTLSTACCDEGRESDTALSADAIRALASDELKVPDRYEENAGPPRYRHTDFNDSTRFISAGDMTAYGRAALKQAIARLGPPTKTAIEPMGGGPVSVSYLDDYKGLRVHWARKGPAGPKDFAVMDIGKSQICLTVAAGSDHQLPVRSGCAGLELGCYDQFYPATPPGSQLPTEIDPGDPEYCRKL
ncbi:MAG: hypothetical protein JSR79_02695 [Proteobacteria bacterium]|nr:hypothetical protein [Pseudomonadota bacterium]